VGGLGYRKVLIDAIGGQEICPPLYTGPLAR